MNQCLTDREILALGDEAAFRILYERYWQSLYFKALSRLGNDADAQDVVQEVFISCWRNRHSIQVEDTLAYYLFTALRLSTIKRVTREAKKGRVLPLSIEMLEQLQADARGEQQAKELRSAIGEEISSMPERMRQIFLLSREGQLSIAEIASHLQLSEQTIKNTLTSALKRLRKKVLQFFLFFF